MIEDYLWLLRIIMVVDLMRTLMRFMVQENITTSLNNNFISCCNYLVLKGNEGIKSIKSFQFNLKNKLRKGSIV